MKKGIFYYAVLLLLLAFGTTTVVGQRSAFLGSHLYADSTQNTNQTVHPGDEDFYKFYAIWFKAYKILKSEFYDRSQVTAKKLMYGAIKGMMESVGDHYTLFMDPETTKEFNVDINAKFGGLGIHVDMKNGWLTVISPIENTPAWREGILPGDRIVAIEGKSTEGITSMEAVSKLRGKPGTAVTFSIQREGVKEPFEVTIVRDEIKIETVKSTFIPYKGKRYAYIRITQFSEPTSVDFVMHLTNVLKQKPDGLIVDVRNNPGGLLSGVISIVDRFQNKGLIVYTKGRHGTHDQSFYATVKSTLVPEKLPMVVLANQGSASAAEIFSGAMKDTHRAVVVGVKTFGKGSVQSVFPFEADKSSIRITVAKYFTPSGYVIDKVGLHPDVEEKSWLDVLDDEEKNDLSKIAQSDEFKAFVASKKRLIDKDYRSFQSAEAKKCRSVSLRSLKWMVKSYQNRTQLPKLYDLEFDNQLKKALMIVSHYEDYRKPLKVYQDPR